MPNPDQTDVDADGRGDACDDDIDGDSIPNHKVTKNYSHVVKKDRIRKRFNKNKGRGVFLIESAKLIEKIYINYQMM